jgi:hypothetical protein
MKTQEVISGYVDGKTLLRTLFPVRTPSLRWLDYQKARRRIPFVRIGRLIFYDVQQVRAALQERHTVNAKAA